MEGLVAVEIEIYLGEVEAKGGRVTGFYYFRQIVTSFTNWVSLQRSLERVRIVVVQIHQPEVLVEVQLQHLLAARLQRAHVLGLRRHSRPRRQHLREPEVQEDRRFVAAAVDDVGVFYITMDDAEGV